MIIISNSNNGHQGNDIIAIVMVLITLGKPMICLKISLTLGVCCRKLHTITPMSTYLTTLDVVSVTYCL